MEKQQKKQVKKYISWALLVCIVALLAFLPTIASQEDPEDGPQASILTATAEKRDISTAVLGGGTLTAETAEEITVPAEVKVKEYLVSNGDTVTKGQAIAAVDRVSVMTAITQVQETMKNLQEQIDDVRDETASGKVTATAGGTVKIIYASEGETVQDVMLRDGALAVLSLDGLMAVQVQRNTDLSGGDKVCVTLSDGSEVTGRVESNLEGILTVTVEDDGFAVGEEVKVTTEDGDRIGTGALYIHSQWNVVAYSGTVSRIRVQEGDTVRAGSVLFNLKDTGHSAQFETLTRQHREYEELMLELFKMYQSETVNAPADGIVTGVDENGTYMLSDSGTGFRVTLLANGPGGDENSYINYVGQVTEVGIDGWVMKMNPWPVAVDDYMNPGISLSTELMTQNTVYSGSAPVYVLTEVTAPDESTPSTGTGTESGTGSGTETGTGTEGGTESGSGTEGGSGTGDGTQSGTNPEGGTGSKVTQEWVPYDSVTPGDILLFAGGNGSGVVWIVKVGYASLPQSPQPSGPNASDNTAQGSSGRPSGGSSMGGSMGGGMGGGAQADTELYGLDTVTIASVTAQEQVTIQITVDELDVSNLYVGQTAAVTVEALTGQQFTGTVTDISASGENEGGNSKFTAEITVDKIPDMLPAMSASVSVVLDTAEQVICIPVAALIETGAETLVYTGYDEETEAFTGAVPVTVGVSDGTYVQILSGITEGQTVYYPYYDTLVISTAPEAGGFPFG